MTGICASSCAPQNASRTRPGRGCEPIAASAASSVSVVEHPAPDGAGQRALPARAERVEDAVALAQQPLREAVERLALAAQPVAHALDGQRRSRPAACRSTAATAPSADGDGEDDEPEERRVEQAAVDAPRSSAGIASTGSASTTPKTSKLTAVKAPTRRGGRQARLDEHPVLQRGAERAAAGRDLRQRVARELRGDHGAPAAAPQRDVLELPQAGGREPPAGRTSPGGRAREKRVMSRQEPKTSSMLGNTRYSETPVIASQKIVSDRQPASAARARSRRRPRCALDGVLEPVAERLRAWCLGPAVTGAPRARGERWITPAA